MSLGRESRAESDPKQCGVKGWRIHATAPAAAAASRLTALGTYEQTYFVPSSDIACLCLLMTGSACMPS